MNTVLLVITVLIVTGLIIFMLKTILISKKKEEIKETKRINIGESLSDCKRIEKFDSEEYIKETFNNILYDIKNDIEGGFNTWNFRIDYSKMQFEKIKHRSQFNTSKICLNIDFTDYDKFEIKRIELNTSSKTFNIKDINSEYYKFIYDCYVNDMNERNRREREKVDKSLSDINEIIGKDNLRDMKLDQLLNGE